MDGYLRVGVVLQVPDQTGAEVADIGLEFSDVVPEAVQLGDHDLVAVGAAVAVAPADDSPGHDDDQDSDGSDDLGQPSQVLHLGLRLRECNSIVPSDQELLTTVLTGLAQCLKIGLRLKDGIVVGDPVRIVACMHLLDFEGMPEGGGRRLFRAE